VTVNKDAAIFADVDRKARVVVVVCGAKRGPAVAGLLNSFETGQEVFQGGIDATVISG
jgi:hypothetical protein